LGSPINDLAVNEHPEFEYGEKGHGESLGIASVVSQRGINIIVEGFVELDHIDLGKIDHS
jgi:hypothetical protein